MRITSRTGRRAGFGAVVTLVALTAVLSGCSSSADSSGTSSASGAVTKVSMGIEPWIGYAPWYIAQEKGFFADHGLAVDIVNFGTDADRNAALLAGKTDVSNIDTGRVVQFGAKGQAATAILLEDSSLGADAVLADPSITTADQLRGKSVAFEYGTTSDLLLHYYLLQNSIPFTDVETVNVPAANAGTLLIAGKSPAVVTYEPYIGEATSGANGSKAHVLFGSDAAPGLISDLLVANNDWLKGHPDQAKALIAAWDDSVAYYNSNRADAVAIMAKGVGSTPESLDATLKGVKIFTVKENQDLIASGELEKTFGSIGDTLKAMGTIDTVAPMSANSDFTFLK